MAPNNLIAALEELAKKREEITRAIVTLASVAGVDAAPYLGVPAFVTVDVTKPGGAVDDRPVADRLRDAAQRIREGNKKTPRPQRPASPTTNGTSRAHTVDGELPADILAALKTHGEPMQPKDLATALRKSWSTLAYHVKKLEQAHQVVLSGTTSGRRITLP
jgi:DNA-binding transcriptional ArsR family regulator